MCRLAILAAPLLVLTASLPAEQASEVSPQLFSELRWRNVGPHRASRTRAAGGHPSHPYTFYMAAVNGGVWKTTDAGRVWKPIFDDQPTGSIGTIAIAPSDASTIYVGSGEGLHRPDLSTGDGVYRSTDAGRTWTHLGLRDAQQIPAIVVDPKNPNRLFVAALGHPYGPNEERGIYRSTDGGKTFEKVLSKDENTGGNDVDIDPSNPETVFATMWEERQGPWENSVWAGTNGGVFKSVDGGTTWKPLTTGLPVVVQAISRFRRQTRDGYTPRWPATISPARRAIAVRSVFIAAMMPAKRGRESRPIRGRRAGSVAATCRCRSRIRRIPTS
jgi:photosystem II stability/assembly factor-like uncharacterized protein